MHDPLRHDPTAFLAAVDARHDADQAMHHRDEHHRPLVFPAPEPRLSVAERNVIRWAYHRTNGGVATVRDLRGAQLALLVQEPPCDPATAGQDGTAGDERRFCLMGLRSRAPEAALDTFRRVAERGGCVIAAFDVKAQHALCVETTGGPPRFVPDEEPHPLALHLLVHDEPDAAASRSA